MRILSCNFYDDDVKTKQSTMELMKLKKISFTTTVIALTIAATPLLAKAENNTKIPDNLPIQVAQAQTKIPPRLEKLNLTEKQKSQVAEIVQQGREEMKEILTPEQQEKFKSMNESGQRNRKAFRSLNLSGEQKEQVREFMQSQKSEIESVLTDEQKQELQELGPNFLQR